MSKARGQNRHDRREPTLSGLESELSVLLQKSMPGCSVKIHYAMRWKRNQITVVWTGFAGLLPEERFRLVMQGVPEKLYKDRCSQFVWFELTPTESENELMAMPRSEDIAPRAGEIAGRLLKLRFFDRLAERLNPDPTKSCGGRLDVSRELLHALGEKEADVVDACLFLIHHHAFCDCQALLQVRPTVESGPHPAPKAMHSKPRK